MLFSGGGGETAAIGGGAGAGIGSFHYSICLNLILHNFVQMFELLVQIFFLSGNESLLLLSSSRKTN